MTSNATQSWSISCSFSYLSFLNIIHLDDFSNFGSTASYIILMLIKALSWKQNVRASSDRQRWTTLQTDSVACRPFFLASVLLNLKPQKLILWAPLFYHGAHENYYTKLLSISESIREIPIVSFFIITLLIKYRCPYENSSFANPIENINYTLNIKGDS